MYEIEGEKFTEKNILELFYFQEKEQQFNVANFLWSLIYHFLFVFLTPLFGNIIILMLEKFNKNLPMNMGFLRIANMLEL